MGTTTFPSIELRASLTGATWKGHGEEADEGVVHVRLVPGELGMLPVWPPGEAVECLVNSPRGQAQAAAVVEQCNSGSVVVRLDGPLRPDTRRWPRVACAIPVAFWCGGRHDDGICLNMGVGGMCLRSSSPLPHGARVTVEMELPGASQEVRLVSEVVYTRPALSGRGHEAGLSFTPGASADIETVRRFVLSERPD